MSWGSVPLCSCKQQTHCSDRPTYHCGRKTKYMGRQKMIFHLYFVWNGIKLFGGIHCMWAMWALRGHCLLLSGNWDTNQQWPSLQGILYFPWQEKDTNQQKHPVIHPIWTHAIHVAVIVPFNCFNFWGDIELWCNAFQGELLQDFPGFRLHLGVICLLH